ncbi:MAG: hypothetical protein FWF67_00680 [Fibromonadales bacterium]|nr:hypothetical protein [Fibromonadales bacterium]
MSFYSETLKKKLQEKVAYFRSAGLNREADLLQARLKSLMEKSAENAENATAVAQKTQAENSVVKNIRSNLQTKLTTDARRFPELEKQYILKNLSNAQTLKELKPLRVAYMERLLKSNRAGRSEKFTFKPDINADLSTGPYNNEKILGEALQLVYSQDPLWIEDLKELYFSIMPLSSATAVSKSPL